MKNILKRLLIMGQVAMLTVLVGLSSTAQAVAPANSILQIEVTVTIGGEALDQEEGPVAGVKVGLIPSEPTVSGMGEAVFEGESATITYIITTTANGEDIYTLTPQLGEIEGVAGTPSLVITPTTVELGATAVLSVEGDEVTVPFDGAEDNSINGIVRGANVVIGGQALTVVGITDTEETSTIQLSGSMAPVPAQGTLIAEYRTVEVTIDNVGSLEEAATTGSIPVTLTAQSGADQSSWPGLGLASVNVGAEAPATVELYARYLDGTIPAASSEAGSPVTFAYPEDDGETYYKPDSVEFTAVPDTTLEYLMVFHAGSADREDVVLRANASSFLEYVPGSAKLNNNGLDDREGECEVDSWCVDENSIDVGPVAKNDTYDAVFQMTVSGAEGTATVACNSTNDCSEGEQCVLTGGVGACVVTSQPAESSGDNEAGAQDNENEAKVAWRWKRDLGFASQDEVCWDAEGGWVVGEVRRDVVRMLRDSISSEDIQHHCREFAVREARDSVPASEDQKDDCGCAE